MSIVSAILDITGCSSTRNVKCWLKISENDKTGYWPAKKCHQLFLLLLLCWPMLGMVYQKMTKLVTGYQIMKAGY